MTSFLFVVMVNCKLGRTVYIYIYPRDSDQQVNIKLTINDQAAFKIQICINARDPATRHRRETIISGVIAIFIV